MEVDSSNMINGSNALSSLNVLLVSDTHYALDQLNALTDVMQNQPVHCVFHSGDIVDLSMDDMNVSADEEESRRRQVGDVISKLSVCAGGAPVYYIPGNHDPISMFSGWKALQATTSMVHKTLCRVTPSLVLAGFGGSVPGYLNGQQVWKSVPFQSNEEMQAELQPLLESICAERGPALTEHDSVIFISHVGPDGSDTALDRGDHGSPENAVHGGSTYWGKSISEQAVQSHIALNIHGHTHAGFGYTTIGRVPIINPGSLKEGRYGRLVLRQNSSGRWGVESIAFHSLP